MTIKEKYDALVAARSKALAKAKRAKGLAQSKAIGESMRLNEEILSIRKRYGSPDCACRVCGRKP